MLRATLGGITHFCTSALLIVCAALVLALTACSDRAPRSEPTGVARAPLTVPGLVAAYGFDETTGSAVIDATGTGHDTALSGQARTAGKYGGALVFEENRLTVADDAALDFTTAFTLSAWVHPSDPPTGWHTVLLKENGTEVAYSLYSSMEVGDAGAYCTIAGQERTSSSGSVLPAGSWSHLAATYDGAALRVFVNGELAADTPVTGSASTSSGPLSIGGNIPWGEYFSGTLDELRLYDRALSLAELRSDIHTPINLASPDTTAPIASVTLPANNAKVAGPVAIHASATDDTSVAAVKFFVDGTLVSEDPWPPFEAVWDSTLASAGTHTLSIQARDAAENTTTSSVSVTIVPDALVAAYGFDEGGGAVLHDATGNGHDAELTNQTWVTGKYGTALAFVDDYLTVADSSLLDLSTGVTLSAWVRPTGTPTTWPTIVLKEKPAGLSYALYSAWSDVEPALCIGALGGDDECIHGGGAPIDTWTHLAGTYDGTQYSIYVNGTLIDTAAQPTPAGISAEPLRIGGNGIWNEQFIGAIDELRIYARPLSATEIALDMGTPLDCGSNVDDGNPCTTDACTSTTGITHTPVPAGTSCEIDGNLCNGQSTCNAAATCVAGTPPTVDDGNPCTGDTCNPTTGVVHTPVAPGTSCSNNDTCDGAETCNASAACVAGTPPAVDDGNPCTTDACDPIGGVTHVAAANGTTCPDSNTCNGTETCQAGTCTAGSPLNLDDNNACTTDACEPTTGVTHTPVAAGSSCANSNACDGAETCDASGTCLAGTPPLLDDGNPCTADACDPTSGITHTPVAAATPCSDGNTCNGAETCNVAATCIAGNPPVLTDNNPCTADTCDPSEGIIHTPIAAGVSCADASLCNGNELCDGGGACLPGTPVPVQEGNPCQTGTCDPATGIVTYTPAAEGTTCFIDLCTAGTCDSNGECAATGGSPADDADPCTVDTCDPETGEKHRTCPQLDPGIAHSVFLQTQWLYTGSDPVQVGVAPGTIVSERASALKGKVSSRSGAPISGAVVSVLNHLEYGYTITQADGSFDLAINGGGALIVRIEKEGYLGVQRAIDIGWSQWRALDEVVMIPSDSIVTAVDLVAPPSDFQVAQGSTQSDSSGTRAGTLLVPAGVDATMIHTDGSIEQLDVMNIRITEFTVGPTGLAAMPASLPKQSAYTYAFEVNADEAVAVGARSIQFSQPLPYYVDNFLGFPAGTAVPFGSYDREAGAWVAEESGIVLKIISITSGLANLDVTGDDIAEGSAQLTLFGITTSEREALAQLYPSGKSLWRVRLHHFTAPADCNWPWRFPSDAIPPNGDPPTPPPTPDSGCGSAGGSVIECETQIFHEDIPLGGTPYKLHYSSARVPGYRPLYHIDIPLTTTVPPSLARVDLNVEIAGRSFKSTYPPLPDQVTSFEWDGFDASGRPSQGSQKAIITVSYFYEITYWTGQYFGDVGGGQSIAVARLQAPLERITEVPLGPYTAAGVAVGGWIVDAHVGYDPTGRRVDFGNGQRQTSDSFPPVIRRLLLAPCGNCQGPTDGSVPIGGSIAFSGNSISARPDGSVYIAERRRIWRLDDDGRIFRIAGNGNESAPSGDGGPALAATLDVRSMAVAVDGTIYIAESNRKIRKITPGGIILPFAGTGTTGPIGDGGPASQATFVDQLVLAVAADGSVLVGEWQGTGGSGSRVRRIDTSGRIQTVAGHGPGGSIQFEVPATTSFLLPEHIAASPDGSFYVSHFENGRSVIVRVDSDGIVHHVGGCVQSGCPGGDNLPAKQHRIIVDGLATDAQSRVLYTTASAPSDFVHRIEPGGQLTRIAGSPTPSTYRDGSAALAVDPLMSALTVVPDGLIALSSSGNEVRKIQSAMPGIAVGTVAVGRTADGAVMTFDGNGKGLDIRHGLTGSPLLTFGYTTSGLFERLTDDSGQATRIERDTSGKPTAIVGPFGQRTTVELDANGWLAAAVDPEGSRFEATYTASGLIRTFIRPGNLTTEVTYDAEGRVATDRDAAGGTMTFTRTPQSGGWDVSRTTPLGRTTIYPTRYTSLAQTRTPVQPSGDSAVISAGRDKVTSVTHADGSLETSTEIPDPRLGLMWPTVSRTTTLPSGLTRTEVTTHSYEALSPTNIQSFASFTDQSVIGNQTWRTVYTPSTRTFTTTTPESRTSTRIIDAFGRTTRTQVNGLHPIDLTYDTSGRLEQAIQSGRITTNEYFAAESSSAGYLSTVTDALSVATTFTRDALGRTLTETRAGATTTFTWDPLNNLQSVTPPGKPNHGMTYTPLNFLGSYNPPPATLATSSTGYTYDLDRMLRTETRPTGDVIVRTPDAAGRLDTIAIPGGLIDYDYYPPGTPSAAGKTSDIRGPYGTDLNFTYDGMLATSTSWSGDVSGSVAWQYNNDFNKIRETVTGQTGSSFAVFGYDKDQLLTCASPVSCSGTSATNALRLTRNPQHGMVTGLALGSTNETWSYNQFGELARQTATFAPSTPLLDITYDAPGFERDKLGRIVRKTEVTGGVTTVYQYTYDALRRLTDVTINGTLAEHFEYDANGNRALGYNAAAGTTYVGVYDDQDRLLSYGPWVFTYTANGELETKTNSATGEAWLFQYDVLGNLLTVGLPNGDLVEYLVDGMGRRVGKMKNGVLLRQWIYRDALKPVAELDGAGNLVAQFVYGSKGNAPDYLLRGGTAYRVISDHLGSPRHVVNVTNSGDVPFTASYTSFGEVSGTGLEWMPFGFAGGIYDSDSGLVRFGARDYDSVLGRWTGKDPLRLESGVNLYAYADNDPVNRIDVSGQEWNSAVCDALAGITSGLCANILKSGGRNAAPCIFFQTIRVLCPDPQPRQPPPDPGSGCEGRGSSSAGGGSGGVSGG